MCFKLTPSIRNWMNFRNWTPQMGLLKLNNPDFAQAIGPAQTIPIPGSKTTKTAEKTRCFQ